LTPADFTEIGAALRLCHAKNEHESGTFSRSAGKYGLPRPHAALIARKWRADSGF